MKHLVIVGASLAGVRAAEAARSEGFAGAISLIGDEIHLPYDRPSLSKEFLEPDGDTEPIHLSSDESLRDLDITLALGETAIRLDTTRQVVVTDHGEYNYSSMVIATGSSPIMLPGAENLDGVHVVRTLEDSRAVRSALDRGSDVVVIGGGFIGAEVASAARKRGSTVSIVEAAEVPLVRAVGADMGASLSSLHAKFGTELLCGTSVSRFEGTDHVEAVVLGDGRRIPADLVVVGVGSRPATSWLTDGGLELDNGVVCDEYLRTSAPNVYAAGDVASWHNPLFDRRMRIEHFMAAAEQGARAARNAVTLGLVQPYVTVPYFWSDWYGSRIQFVGVTTEDYEVVSGGLGEDHFVVLFRSGDGVVGALTLNGQRHIMKYRRMIEQQKSYAEALDFAAARRAAAVSG
ncbi:NAD(P)/FAD-dependent oxidoreductase [Gordonia hongkongensis]|uniref:NAD(P)/FAD-dependent oxidoreductase n=1 Tax=Gordonia hongkongensis TaxID=1701090 RepID=UPI003EBC3AC9